MGCLLKCRFGTIRARTEEPDHSIFPEKFCNWAHTCCAGAREVIPLDAPRPLGERVVKSTHADTNLHHDPVSGGAVTGILHLANKTPIDWCTKLQARI